MEKYILAGLLSFLRGMSTMSGTAESLCGRRSMGETSVGKRKGEEGFFFQMTWKGWGQVEKLNRCIRQ
jgi:hypothetical protein